MKALSTWLVRADTELARDVCAGLALLAFCAAALVWLPVLTTLVHTWRQM